MVPELPVKPADRSLSNSESTTLDGFESEIISHICRVYTRLECLIAQDASKLSNSGRANIRRAQGELQKLRLKMLDHFEKKLLVY